MTQILVGGGRERGRRRRRRSREYQSLGLLYHRQEIVGFAAPTQPKSVVSSSSSVRFRYDVRRTGKPAWGAALASLLQTRWDLGDFQFWGVKRDSIWTTG